MFLSKIQLTSNLTQQIKDEINKLVYRGFNEGPYSDNTYFTDEDNVYVIYLYDTIINKIIGCSFVSLHHVDNYNKLPNEYIKIYNFTIDPDYRGQKLSHRLMKQLLQSKIKGKPIKKYYIRLNVFTSKNNPNLAAIRCYQKYKFQFIPTVVEMRSEGPYTDMIREPDLKRKRTTKRKHKKTKKKKKY